MYSLPPDLYCTCIFFLLIHFIFETSAVIISGDYFWSTVYSLPLICTANFLFTYTFYSRYECALSFWWLSFDRLWIVYPPLCTTAIAFSFDFCICTNKYQLWVDVFFLLLFKFASPTLTLHLHFAKGYISLGFQSAAIYAKWCSYSQGRGFGGQRTMWKFCIYVFSALFIPLLEGKTDLAKIHAATKLKKIAQYFIQIRLQEFNSTFPKFAYFIPTDCPLSFGPQVVE